MKKCLVNSCKITPNPDRKLCPECFIKCCESVLDYEDWVKQQNETQKPTGEPQMKCALCDEPTRTHVNILCQKHYDDWCKTSLALNPFIAACKEQPTPKKNQGKPRMGLLRWGFLSAIAEALTFGATKYPEENYLNLPSEELFESMLRHISELRQGKTHDEESGLHHAKHVAANCMMWFETLAKEGKL